MLGGTIRADPQTYKYPVDGALGMQRVVCVSWVGLRSQRDEGSNFSLEV